MDVSELIKLFGMQNLLLESELRKLEESGIQIEHTKTIQKAEIMDVELFELTSFRKHGGWPTSTLSTTHWRTPSAS